MGVNCCDVCELVGFCQFMNEHEIQKFFPNLNEFAACDSSTSPENYREELVNAIEQLKSGKITPVSAFSTADLVKELSRRENVELIESISPAQGTYVKGPAKILVVKE